MKLCEYNSKKINCAQRDARAGTLATLRVIYELNWAQEIYVEKKVKIICNKKLVCRCIGFFLQGGAKVFNEGAYTIQDMDLFLAARLFEGIGEEVLYSL